jgi:hypothetical protein
LAVLLATLVPAGMVKEEDTAWTFESLLRVSLLATPVKPLYLFNHCRLWRRPNLQEITDELSNTPKTVIEVINPAAAGPTTAAGAGAGAGAGPPSPTPPQGDKSKAVKGGRQERDKEKVPKGSEGSSKNKK